MKRRSILHYLLEIVVILGYLVLGITIFTFTFQKIPIDKIYIGSIVLAMGTLELVDYVTWKYATKIRSMQSFVSAIFAIALGFVLMFVKMEPKTLCYFLGWFSIGFSVVRISTASINLAFQPLINSVRIVLSITRIVFSILLLARNVNAIDSFILFLGIAFVIEAVILFIEFMIHRYQSI